MAGKTDLNILLRDLEPELNDGQYIFATLRSLDQINRSDTILEFKESQGTTVIVEKVRADQLELSYEYIAAWITLKVHSSLAAVGLTAAISSALARENISCNIVSGYFHDHLFVENEKAMQAMKALFSLSQK